MLIRVAAFASLTGFLYGCAPMAGDARAGERGRGRRLRAPRPPSPPPHPARPPPSYDEGLVGGAALYFGPALGLTEREVSAVVAAGKGGALVGCYLGAALMHRSGRRPAIAAVAAGFVVGPVIMAAAGGAASLVAGRLVVGAATGAAAVAVPAYLAELAPPALRGRIVQMFEVALAGGMLAASLADAVLAGVGRAPWRWMVGAPLLPALLLVAGVGMLPESPRWLVVAGRLDDAVAVLRRVVPLPPGAAPPPPGAPPAAVEAELLALWSSVEKDRAAAAAAAAADAAARGAAHGARPRSRLGLLAGGGSRNSGWGSGVELAAVGGGGERAAAAAAAAAAATPAVLPPSPPPPLGHARRGSMDDVTYRAVDDGARPAGLAPIKTRSEAGSGGGGGGEGGGGGASSSSSDAATARAAAHRAPLPPLPAALSPAGGALPPGEASYLSTLASVVSGAARVARGPERRALALALALAAGNQACASSAVVNFAPELLRGAGVEGDARATLLSAAVTGSKGAGVLLFLVTIDKVGRRPLALVGSAAMALSLAALAAADAASSPPLLLASLCAFIFAFSASHAGLFWVLTSELFSMGAKAPAAAAATAALFGTGALTNLAFLPLHTALGPPSFLLYAGVAAATGCVCWGALPETKGATLAEASAAVAAGGGRGGCGGCWPRRRPRYARFEGRAAAASTESAF